MNPRCFSHAQATYSERRVLHAVEVLNGEFRTTHEQMANAFSLPPMCLISFWFVCFNVISFDLARGGVNGF